MSWMSQLYKTYEENIGKSGEHSITPIAHMNANAQVEITLDLEGNFVNADKLDKKNGVTLIPVTEASAGRSSGVTPHPLSDTLSYMAGDYADYCAEEKQTKKAAEKFECYIKGLEKWINSKQSHVKVNAIYQYLSEKVLISDLVKSGIVILDENGKFSGEKISGQPYEKVLVRFRIQDDWQTKGTWEDSSIIEAYTNYYLLNQEGKEDVCYLSGQRKTISENHPKGIVASDYGAKLVSANDSQGYTYRGRFQDSGQAYALSYEASQKIHSALTWLIKRQGFTIGTKEKRTFVCWNPEGKRVPDILDDLGISEDEDDTGIDERNKLGRTLSGDVDQFEADEQIIVMGLDAATTGRLSITYYNEFMASDFLDRVSYWKETCRWLYLKLNEQKRPSYKPATPNFQRIAECAFGTERGNFLEADDKIMKERVQRLLKCMLEKQSLPSDIIQALVSRASTPLAYSSWNREYVLSTACAMIAKRNLDRNTEWEGVNNQMKLDEKNRERSYLFGRLLAVLEKAERITYERGEGREPNAIRLQSAYVNHPMQTWLILETALNPYFQKMRSGSREYYKKLISEIIGLLQEEGEALNYRLNENYLLGYYLQRAELNEKREEMKEETINELSAE